MPKTINLKKILSTELKSSGLIGGDPQFDVEIVCRRGAAPEFCELVRVVMPIEAWIEAQRKISTTIDRQISQAEYLKGLRQ